MHLTQYDDSRAHTHTHTHTHIHTHISTVLRGEKLR